MAGAEPGAGVSSLLPQASGNVWEVVLVPWTRSLRRAAVMCWGSPVAPRRASKQSERIRGLPLCAPPRPGPRPGRSPGGDWAGGAPLSRPRLSDANPLGRKRKGRGSAGRDSSAASRRRLQIKSGVGHRGKMVDYSVWDHIEVSDDEDETHPNIDTASLFRWRHQARVERMEQFQKEKEELDRGCRECKRKVAECQRKLKELEVAEGESSKAELERLQAEAQQLRREERNWEQKLEEMRKKEKSMPWNVDTLSKDGFSKSMVNTKPEQAEEESEEVREQKHKTFVEKYEKQIKHFGMLRRWDDSQKYLSDNVHLVCEETANYLVIWCIDLEVEEKCALMEQVAHQTIVMQFILELAKSLKVDPRACFRQFFTKIKTADRQYMEGFNDELEAFKERVRGRAKLRIEKAMKEYEEEERRKRLGPGGLDPVEVYESLPEELQKCFDVKDVQMLQDAISKMDPTDAKYHMQRCIDSGLWVPNSKSSEAKEGEEAGPGDPLLEAVKPGEDKDVSA
ncbi:Hsp90 co-chaperone Cdc37 [Pteropus alecto]|uniref:Hsp90 co-chaperone Cdc37 n=2 Tax=Pteropus TaxID=9401 RepID=L5L465_PTEAL|nr:Hsp90 co-chaperone Cdc37 [Pteropus alecto]